MRVWLSREGACRPPPRYVRVRFLIFLVLWHDGCPLVEEGFDSLTGRAVICVLCLYFLGLPSNCKKKNRSRDAAPFGCAVLRARRAALPAYLGQRIAVFLYAHARSSEECASTRLRDTENPVVGS